MAKNYITNIGFQKLKEEYDHLKHSERPEVVQIVSWAAGNGDRSENGDYIYGKKRLREIDHRIGQLMKKMEDAEIITPNEINNNKIVFGATVTVEHEDGHQATYQIVGEDESDTESKKISWKAPIAKALLGKTEGDEVKLIKPQGEEFLEIIKIEYK